MDTYLSIQEAAQLMQVTEVELTKLASMGKIRSIMHAGTTLINARDLRTHPGITEQPEYANFSHLVGVAIGINEAAKRYQIEQSTVSRWVKSGLIAKIGKDGLRVLIDEAQIATAAAIYHKAGGSHGTWIFSKGKIHNTKSRCD